MTYGLEEHADLVVYHCVDLLDHFQGVDPIAIRQGEAALALLQTAVPVASSRTIRDHLVDRGFSSVLIWENVADVEMIEARSSDSRRLPGHAIFAGNLTLQKVDFALLRRLVESDPSLILNLAGPLAEGGGEPPDISWFRDHPRVEVHGTLEPEALAELLARCTVGLIPYHRSPYTDGVFPMKVYEYLAAGLAVVSTDLPSLRHAEGVKTCADAEGFIRSARLLGGKPSSSEVSRRMAIARRHSWTARRRQILDLVAERLPFT